MSFARSSNPAETLPRYRVRHSSRARHVSLTIHPADGLVIVVPNGFDEQLIPGLIHTKRSWIDARLRQFSDALINDEAWLRPARMTLPAVNEHWSIKYQANSSTTVRISTQDKNMLRATGAIDAEVKLHAALRRWLKRRADLALPQRLTELADRHDFSFTRVTIRQQRTRWGSCSSRGTISLNAKLLFIAPELVDHVLLHELCHTLHAHHGDSFQALMADLMPNHRQQRVALREAWTHIPRWAHR
ncbi:MAG: SprT family zinc-dependent metalloprotease [Gammaproteobacteria bacterium]|jgi:hypothetical protein|nr:hypothetical protein [Chromatiales bacterium]MDP6674236.1 SprT family zinc-dependent metalloprotease [Gammaproteobacteria bacterium]